MRAPVWFQTTHHIDITQAQAEHLALLPRPARTPQEIVETQQTIKALMAKLTEREAEAIRLHFGLNGGYALRLNQLAAELGCPKLSARHLIGKAFKKMRG